VEQELLTFPEPLSSPPVFSGGSCYSIFSFICMFCHRCLSFCTIFFWPLCCLFFDIRFLIAPLVSSNSSFNASALEPAVYRTQSENEPAVYHTQSESTDHYITITIPMELEDRQQNIKSSESHSWFIEINQMCIKYTLQKSTKITRRQITQKSTETYDYEGHTYTLDKRNNRIIFVIEISNTHINYWELAPITTNHQCQPKIN